MNDTILAAYIGGGTAIVAAIIVGVLTYLKRDNASQSSRAKGNGQVISSSGGGNAVNAGGNVHIGDTLETKARPAKLEITHVSFTHDSEFDVQLRNLGDDAVVITKISILMIKDYEASVLPILSPSAKYMIRVDGMKSGETRSLDISHVVDAHQADRILIALDTTRTYRLEVSLHYNLSDRISFEKNTWDYTNQNPT